MTCDAKRNLARGADYPFDGPSEWYDIEQPRPPLPPFDWAHAAARGILADLNDRSGIKHGFIGISEDVRAEIIGSLAAIIREAYQQSLPDLLAQSTEKIVTIDYTNWRGVRELRLISPIAWHITSNKWHPIRQWMLAAADIDKGELRYFALSGIHAWSEVAAPADEK